MCRMLDISYVLIPFCVFRRLRPLSAPLTAVDFSTSIVLALYDSDHDLLRKLRAILRHHRASSVFHVKGKSFLS